MTEEGCGQMGPEKGAGWVGYVGLLAFWGDSPPTRGIGVPLWGGFGCPSVVQSRHRL